VCRRSRPIRVHAARDPRLDTRHGRDGAEPHRNSLSRSCGNPGEYRAAVFRLRSATLVHHRFIAAIRWRPWSEETCDEPKWSAVGYRSGDGGGTGLPRGGEHVSQVQGLEAHDGALQGQLQTSWDARVDSWSEQVESSAAFARVRDVVLERADPN